MRLAVTSGTTGTPKGVLQTHGEFVRRLDRLQCDVVESPRVLPPNLHASIGLNLAMHALCRGGSVVFPSGYDNEPFFAAVREHRVTHVALPPSSLALMLPALPESGPAFPGIRHMRFVGGTPSPGFMDQVRRRFSPQMYLPYGLGEIGHAAMATPDILLQEPASVGPPGPGVRLEVLDEAGLPVPPGVSGEIRVAIEDMPQGYYGPDANDHSKFRDGWFHPGDRGRIDARGLVFVEGRLDDVLNLGGRKVAPRFVESILEDFAGVREAAVFAIEPGPEGTRIAAAIVPSGALDWAALKAHALARLEARAPVRYYEAESLPRNSMGKLIREEIGPSGRER